MVNESIDLPDYVAPPLVEVVCGVSFPQLGLMKAAHLGLYWQRIRDRFPVIEERPPIGMQIEAGGLPGQPTIQSVEFSEMPPLPRTWFVDESGDRIVQLQADAFLYNWRNQAEASKYPRFKVVYSGFRDEFLGFSEFAAEAGLGQVLPIQFELTYVNHVTESVHWARGQTVGNLLPDFSWRSGGRFLPPYEAINWRTVFPLPDGMGRLHLSVNSALRKGDEPIVVIELRARGVLRTSDHSGMDEWFAMAHRTIVHGFSDLTGEDVQKDLWGRKV